MKSLVGLLCFSISLLSYNCSAQEKSLIIDTIKRNYKLRIPSSYSGLEKVPVVFVLHGYHNDVKGIGEYTGFDNLSEKNGFICVYPIGTINDNDYYIWNAGGIYNEWTNNANDIRFIDSLIQFIVANYSVNEKMIYVAGHSNGSMMAYNLATHLSEKIAAIACVSGPMIDDKTIPECPVAVMHIHGDADLAVPHTGTLQYGFQIPAVDQVIKKWLEWNNCSTIPVILKYDPKITALKWQGDAEVRLYLIHGQGHDWPSIERGGWPASDYIWEFFKENSKK